MKQQLRTTTITIEIVMTTMVEMMIMMNMITGGSIMDLAIVETTKPITVHRPGVEIMTIEDV